MDFLRTLRAAYPGCPLLLVLDRASCHTAQKSQKLAAHLGVHLLWLPKQRPELNCMGQLWRALKQRISANRQYSSVNHHVADAISWVLELSAEDALGEAGCLAEGFWLRHLLENFWRPTWTSGNYDKLRVVEETGTGGHSDN